MVFAFKLINYLVHDRFLYFSIKFQFFLRNRTTHHNKIEDPAYIEDPAAAQANLIREGFLRNFTDYIDPDPNCVTR